MITSIGISSKLFFLFVYCSIPKFLIDSVDLHQLLAAPFFMAKLTGKDDFPVILKNKNDMISLTQVKVMWDGFRYDKQSMKSFLAFPFTY